MARYELTDFKCGVVLRVIPNKSCGKPRVDDRRELNATS